MFFNTVDNGKAKSFFYGLIRIDKEDAESVFNAIKTRFEEEDRDHFFANYVKRNLRSFISDGAAVMLGHKGGLVTKFNAWTDTKSLFSVHCMAHR